jgi:hypothetical protein
MLLSFYDSYWSDEFIADSYEGAKTTFQSTNDYPDGSTQLNLENEAWETFKSAGGYYGDFIFDNSSGISNYEQYFQLKLLSIGLENIDYPYGMYCTSFITTLEEQAEILDSYFDLIFGDHDYYRELGVPDETNPLNIYVKYESDEGESRQSIINIIKEQVGSGNPVIYRGRKSSSEGHAMIAFNVTDNGDVELHIGKTNYSYAVAPVTINTTVYKHNIGVLWIEINEELLPHSCSDNYIWKKSSSEDTTTTTACSCIAYSKLHPSHVHELEDNVGGCTTSNMFIQCNLCEKNIEVHNYNIANKSPTEHWLECECGEKVNISEHIYSINHYSQTSHYYECECGETTPNVAHNKIHTVSDAAGHSGYCECGYEFTDEPHNLQNCLPLRPNAASHHRGTCACGYSSVESHTFEGIGLGRYKCTKCSYTKGLYDDNEKVHLGIEDDEESETE